MEGAIPAPDDLLEFPMTDLDAELRLEMAAAAAREYTAQLARTLEAEKWQVRLVVPVDAVVMSRRLHTPMLRARREAGRIAVGARPDGDIVIVVKRVHEVEKVVTEGETPRVCEEESWHAVLTSSTPIATVLAVGMLAAFQPDDLRLDGA